MQRSCSRCGAAATKHGRCDRHQRGPSHHAKPWYHKLYRRARWLKLRAWHLQQNPFCLACEHPGSEDNPLHVDHIIDHFGDERLFWDPKNLQTLCETCHGVKTAST